LGVVRFSYLGVFEKKGLGFSDTSPFAFLYSNHIQLIIIIVTTIALFIIKEAMCNHYEIIISIVLSPKTW